MRYMGGDTTLTDDDYHYLYYGYAYDPNYRPLEVTPSSDRILEILAAVQQDTPTSEQAQSIVDAAREIMAVDPFSPKNINFMTYAYEALGDTVQARVNADRFAKIIRTIEKLGQRSERERPEACPAHGTRQRCSCRTRALYSEPRGEDPFGGIYPVEGEGRQREGATISISAACTARLPS
ncbi:MAG: DUF4919 domain-containing protein [Alistipes putredinis]|nr:MAG: DUF4919 domain-containing protein [Alistipes putredinis]